MKTIEKEQILKGIERSNPWWSSGNVEFSNLPKRLHFDRLYHLAKQKDPVRALVLMGPRRVGKTVLVYQIINQLIQDGYSPKKVMYLSLDNPLFRFNSLEELFLWGMAWAGSNTENAIILFDEIQYLPNWEQQLKVLVDTYRQVKFVVTGSAAAALNKKSKESGAGRFTNYLLPALSFYEYLQIKGAIEKTPLKSIDLLKMNSLYLDYLNFGAFPESISSEAIRNQPEQYLGQDILDKVLGRDLPSIYGINNPNELQRLFAALAFNTSNEISPEAISNQAGIKKVDIDRYIEFFEAAFLMRVIDKTDLSIKTFQRRTQFKIILTIPSLRSAIFGKLSAEDKDLEGLAETAIFSQLLLPEGVSMPYKYARWNRGNSKGEVDLVYVTPNNHVHSAMEIKWSDRFALGEDKPKSLISFCKENKLQMALMSSKTVFSETNFENLKVFHFPTSFLCFVIGMMTGLIESTHYSLKKQGFSGEAEALSKIDSDQLVGDLMNNLSASLFLTDDLMGHLSQAIKLVSKNLLFKRRS